MDPSGEGGGLRGPPEGYGWGVKGWGARRAGRPLRHARPAGQVRNHSWAVSAAALTLIGTMVVVLVTALNSSGRPLLAVASPSGASTAGAAPRLSLPIASVEPEAAASTTPSAVPSPGASTATVRASRFGAGLLIADRGNGRLLFVDDKGKVLWRFPVRGSLAPGQRFAADDAFISPDGKTIVANEEQHEVIVRIDIATRKVIWQYGHFDRAGSGRGQLHTPDDAYPLANGDIIVADIENCRILQIAPDKHVVHQWGRTGVCVDRAPWTYGRPNGDTPLPDGGILITEIKDSRVVRLSASGRVLFDFHVPVRYPSDAQLMRNGNVLVADYSSPGQVVIMSPTGHLVWRYAPTSGVRRLDHPSLAVELADGTIALNDDFRHRIVVIDPRTDRIVWQYGHTDRRGTTAGYLYVPDGIDPIPMGTALGGSG